MDIAVGAVVRQHLIIDLEYGHPAGAQVKIRAQAFMEMLESRAS